MNLKKNNFNGLVRQIRNEKSLGGRGLKTDKDVKCFTVRLNSKQMEFLDNYSKENGLSKNSIFQSFVEVLNILDKEF